ncbi:hypothetical protein GmHk_12G035508 [Glycine max]|nr:hypothetical protein GmHk_12G035508 [Glycine max]
MMYGAFQELSIKRGFPSSPCGFDTRTSENFTTCDDLLHDQPYVEGLDDVGSHTSTSLFRRNHPDRPHINLVLKVLMPNNTRLMTSCRLAGITHVVFKLFHLHERRPHNILVNVMGNYYLGCCDAAFSYKRIDHECM